jgi:hypothetical protein
MTLFGETPRKGAAGHGGHTVAGRGAAPLSQAAPARRSKIEEAAARTRARHGAETRKLGRLLAET